ncbi:MAG: metallophosphoesterase [Phaeodactylibacter sp.]|nr:metallophosphoesterase [Phaeodactylibacter sp.]MCB9290251.1 metallophosphoesterase [Lewinellaceae bacterium]
MRIFFLAACLSIGAISFPLSLEAQNPGHTTTHPYEDGPYIFFENGQAIARWVTENGLEEDTLRDGRPAKIFSGAFDAFDPAYLDLEDTFQPAPTANFKKVSRVAAVSDIHGQYGLLIRLLTAHQIIDNDGNWAFGQGHLVVLGDIFDRGDEVTSLLWFIYKLEKQAEKAGGMVHYLLGNHEIMALKGDLRYINKKYRYTMAAMGMPYDKLFGPDTYLGRWLRSKPVAISINKTAFVHAGFSKTLLSLGLNFDAINSLFREHIIDQPEDSILADPYLAFLYSEDGPVWYRGYFEEGFTKWQASEILGRLGERHIVVGHTSFHEIVSLFHNKIIGIDSSIKNGKNGEILLINKKKFYRGTLNGKLIRIK